MAQAQGESLLRCIRRAVGAADAARRTDAQLLTAFRAHGDEAAFRTLLARHGPLVLNACRQVLRDEADIEDAFQATFLVLLRKAASIREGQALGGWLFRVARRLASEARAAASRRRQCEDRAAARAATSETPPDSSWREASAVLHEELDRLPDKFRQPLVLCYLQGLSRDEAAKQLGWSAGAVKGRLERGRQVLRNRLVRRGFALSAGLLAALENSPAAGCALPPRLIRLTLRAATDSCPAPVAALVEGGLRTMVTGNNKVMAAALLIASVVAGTGWLASPTLAPNVAAAAQEKPPAKAPRDADKPAEETRAYSGRVIGPDGQPVADAKLFLALPADYVERIPPSEMVAKSGADGRFRFRASRAKHGPRPMTVVATADGHGPAWAEPKLNDNTEDLTLKLVKDDVPVSGRVLDLEGRPVPGATVRLLEILAPAKADLGPWLAAAAAGKGNDRELERDYLNHKILAPDVPGLASSATTDADGRFRLSGVGRERVAVALIEGPTLATTRVGLLTRASPPLLVPLNRDDASLGVTTYYGASFTHTAAPTKIVAGVVRDKDTKKPLAGVRVQSTKLANSPLHGNDFVRTVTDAAGRYRLVGLPKGEGNKIHAIPGSAQPYLVTLQEVEDTPGLGPVTVDFELKRGVWVKGRVSDKATGKPVSAIVEYYALGDNPHLDDYPGFDASYSLAMTQFSAADGTFRLVGLPGPGVVAVKATDHYLLAHQRDDADGAKEATLDTRPFALEAFTVNATAGVDPAKGADAVTRDVTLDAGVTYNGTVLDPDGKPLSGARVYGSTGWHPWNRPPLKTASFTVRAFNPRRPRSVFFQHLEKGLVGTLEVPEDGVKDVTARLRPGAAVSGRLVDSDGRPRTGAELAVYFRPKGNDAWSPYYPGRLKTDKDGRFRIGAMLPELPYSLHDGKGWVSFDAPAKSGESKDLGDVRAMTGNE